MKIFLKRIYFGKTYTTGRLYLDDGYLCDTLEPADRALEWDGKKLKGTTAIPLGTYRLIIDYSPTFCRNMPHLLNVPNFTGIRIHTGNCPSDTEGCILVGRLVSTYGSNLMSSSAAFQQLMKRLSKATDEITITITR